MLAAAPTLPSRCRVPSPRFLCPPAPGLGVLGKDEPSGPTFPCWNWSSGGQGSQQEGRKGLGSCKWRRLSGFQHLCFGKETPKPLTPMQRSTSSPLGSFCSSSRFPLILSQAPSSFVLGFYRGFQISWSFPFLSACISPNLVHSSPLPSRLIVPAAGEGLSHQAWAPAANCWPLPQLKSVTHGVAASGHC